jgi:sterol desaturase/sphingolipid hydroxylase (fatty acid hydroxylase superfamily)
MPDGSMGKERLFDMKYGSASPRIRLFRNDLMEQLTLVSPPVFALTWTVFLAVAAYASWGVASLPVSIALVLLGMLTWTLFEYAMHRFLFHLKPRSAFGRAFIFLAHGNHHAAPGDRYRNIMPPLVSVAISAMIWAALWLLCGSIGSVIFLGFGIGYVVYDAIHYACHQLPMRGPLLRHLRRHHIRHHHARQEGNYAITATFWDRLFRTEIAAKRR